MIATGVLDYSLTENIADGEVSAEAEAEADEDVANDGDDADDSILGKAITDF